MGTYRDLEVWRRSLELVAAVYRATRQFPAEERYSLRDQIQRSVISVPANIAEGHGRIHRGDTLRFLSIARGSLYETEAHIEIANSLGYLDRETFDHLWSSVQALGRLMNGLIRSTKAR
jgi:four helix bundle protein